MYDRYVRTQPCRREPVVCQKENRPPVLRTDGLRSFLEQLTGGKLDLSDMVLLLILLIGV